MPQQNSNFLNYVSPRSLVPNIFRFSYSILQSPMVMSGLAQLYAHINTVSANLTTAPSTQSGLSFVHDQNTSGNSCPIPTLSSANLMLNFNMHYQYCDYSSVLDKTDDKANVETVETQELKDNGKLGQMFFPNNNGIATCASTLIADQKTVRVFMNNGINFGNQAIATNIMHRFKQEGFTGNFEVVYAKSAKLKISALFGLPDNISDSYFAANLNSTFINLHEFNILKNNNAANTVNLCFGVDPAASESVLNAHISEEILPPSSYVSRSEAYHLQCVKYIQFNPYISDTASTNIYSYDGEVKTLPNGLMYYQYPITDIRELSIDLNRKGAHQLQEDAQNLQQFSNILLSQDHQIVQLYGRTYRFTQAENPNFESQTPKNILQLIAGVRKYQINNQYDKPIIVAAYGDFKNNPQQLAAMINHDSWDDFPNAKSIFASMNVIKGLRNKFFIADLHTDNIDECVKKLKNDEILFVHVGILPKNYFDALYHYDGKNILIHTFEGASTSHNLIPLNKKPKLYCGDTDIFLEAYEAGYMQSMWQIAIAKLAPNFKNHFLKFYNPVDGYCGERTGDLSEEVCQYIKDAQNPSSHTSMFFRQLRNDAMKPENDRICNAILEVEKDFKSKK